jgi:hypothetical protein
MPRRWAGAVGDPPLRWNVNMARCRWQQALRMCAWVHERTCDPLARLRERPQVVDRVELQSHLHPHALGERLPVGARLNGRGGSLMPGGTAQLHVQLAGLCSSCRDGQAYAGT